jgi:hypothetical protein
MGGRIYLLKHFKTFFGVGNQLSQQTLCARVLYAPHNHAQPFQPKA